GWAVSEEAKALVPQALAEGTARAVARFASSPAGLSPQVATLMKGALPSMFASRLRVFAALVLVFLAAGGGLLAYRSWGSGPPPRADGPGTRGPRREPGAESPPKLTPLADLYGDPLPGRGLVRLGTSRFRHGAGVAAIAYSPDGKLLATADWNNNLVRLWDAD